MSWERVATLAIFVLSGVALVLFGSASAEIYALAGGLFGAAGGMVVPSSAPPTSAKNTKPKEKQHGLGS